MADSERPEPDSPKTPANRPDPDPRIEREAAALRQNLLRRKQQSRARQAQKAGSSQT